jgi:NAD(P)-dependent dehydrogenase (short-subunit alcohol dehydrogenase family)
MGTAVRIAFKAGKAIVQIKTCCQRANCKTVRRSFMKLLAAVPLFVSLGARGLASAAGMIPTRRITVNTVAPGAIETDFSGGMVRDNPAVNKIVSDMTALGRPGLPDDIGPMIASLLTEDHRSTNAQRIEVSGGMSI